MIDETLACETKHSEERIALASVLQELTVAALDLFDPSRSADPFLDRVAERLGCYAAALVEVDPASGAAIIGANGIGSASRALRISEDAAAALVAGDRELRLPYPELAREDLTCVRFPMSVPERAPVFLLLFFHSALALPAEYRGMVQRLSRVLCIVLMHRDLFARTKASERRLDEQKTLLERIGDASHVGILVLGADSGPLFWNRRFAELWKLDSAEIEGACETDLLAAIAAKVVDPSAFLARASERDVGGEEDGHDEIRLKDGRVFDRRFAPVRSTAGVDYGRAFYILDITERRAAELERERLLETERAARAAAEEAIRARDEFLSVASHELRTPLTSMQLVVQSLRAARERGTAVSPEVTLRLLESVERQTRRLGRLVGELLDVSRIQAGRLTLDREPVDLVEVCEDVIARFAQEIARSGSTVALHGSASVIGDWDRSRIDQVVSNLLSNALKYGAGNPIEITAQSERGWARLEVRDRGIGIAAREIGRLFERFERAVSSQHYGGLGLGLYIVRQIVEMHGGHVSIASEPGVGSIVRVELPLERAYERANAEAQSQSLGQELPSSGG